MKSDALNRRSRFAGRQPTGKRLALQERDFCYFSALERHGPLPATYLYEFSKGTARNYKGHQQRLTDLYNEDNTPHRGFYLERPAQQYASINARYQPMAYENTELAGKALRDKGTPAQIWVPPNGPYLHRFTTACLTASIELAVTQLGHRYISQAEIFTHPKCPASIRQAEHPLALPCRDGVIIPDQLFGIDYGGKYRFFALEADRKNETIVSKKASAKAFGRKLESYIHVLEQESYREVWGIPTLTVMTVTTSLPHLDSMITHLDDLASSKTATRFLFKAKPEFGKYWIVPPVLHDLVTTPWSRTTTPLDIGRP